jgi:undecaprenyl-diphosphatase
MIEQINFTIFHLINQYAGLNSLTDSIGVILANYMPLAILSGLAYLWIRKGKKTREIVLYAIYAAIIGLVLNIIIGMIYFHPRPFMIPTGTLLFPFAPETSFPSDHTTLMVSLSLMLIYFKETRTYGVIFLILGLIGGLARIFSGVHFPMDILGSIVVSIVVTFFVYRFRDRFKPINDIITEFYTRSIGKILKKMNNHIDIRYEFIRRTGWKDDTSF